MLYTWTQDLRRHIHVHALTACGGLDAQGAWCPPQRGPPFLFPVHALSKAFRGKSLEALRRAGKCGELPRDPASTEAARQDRLKVLLHHDGVVYAKTPLVGPEVVLDWLPRYTHRVAVTNERILAVDAAGVCLRVRADQHGGKRTVLIDGPTFIARFLQHVLPPGFKRIRHCGLLSPAVKTERMAAARAALALPAPIAQAQQEAAAFLKRVAGIDAACCPHCRIGHRFTVEVLPANPCGRPKPDLQCRGPP